MKKIIRNRLQIAPCRGLVANEARMEENKILRKIRIQQKGRATLEQAERLTHLRKVREEYEEEARRYRLSAQVDGLDVLCLQR